MKIITLNVNGIRSAAKKGFFEWLEHENADFVCLQETKSQQHQLTAPCFCPTGYNCFYSDAVKKGYSGVAIYAKQPPLRIIESLGWDYCDQEGRYLQLDYQKFSVISLYLPSGSSGDERQNIKFDFLARFQQHLQQLKQQAREFIICGDWNIAHKKIDIKNWRGNQKHSGFLPEEREWMEQLFGAWGFIDAFRVINFEPEQYTWWSNRGQSWLKNVGWRIDYQVVTQGLKEKISNVAIYKEQRFSDHAPLLIEYNMSDFERV